MTDLETTAAEKLSTRAAKRLDALRAAITRADAARSDAAHQARDCRRGAAESGLDTSTTFTATDRTSR